MNKYNLNYLNIFLLLLFKEFFNFNFIMLCFSSYIIYKVNNEYSRYFLLFSLMIYLLGYVYTFYNLLFVCLYYSLKHSHITKSILTELYYNIIYIIKDKLEQSNKKKLTNIYKLYDVLSIKYNNIANTVNTNSYYNTITKYSNNINEYIHDGIINSNAYKYMYDFLNIKNNDQDLNKILDEAITKLLN